MYIYIFDREAIVGHIKQRLYTAFRIFLFCFVSFWFQMRVIVIMSVGKIDFFAEKSDVTLMSSDSLCECTIHLNSNFPAQSEQQ